VKKTRNFADTIFCEISASPNNEVSLANGFRTQSFGHSDGTDTMSIAPFRSNEELVAFARAFFAIGSKHSVRM